MTKREKAKAERVGIGLVFIIVAVGALFYARPAKLGFAPSPIQASYCQGGINETGLVRLVCSDSITHLSEAINNINTAK